MSPQYCNALTIVVRARKTVARVLANTQDHRCNNAQIFFGRWAFVGNLHFFISCLRLRLLTMNQHPATALVDAATQEYHFEHYFLCHRAVAQLHSLSTSLSVVRLAYPGDNDANFK
jgi:hypothetical protein